jgi:ribonuclease HI
MKVLNIYTDGGHRKKLGLGAYAYVILDNNNHVIAEHVRVIEEKDEKITNNIMELKAVIKALNWVKSNGYSPEDHRIYVFTDSQYVQLGITEWMSVWIRKNWKNAAGKEVENRDLWETLNKLFFFDFKYLHIQWIQGHNESKWNNLVDELCTNAMLSYEST